MNELRTQPIRQAAAPGDHDRHGVAVGRATRPTNFVAGALPNRAAYERAIQEIIAAGIDRTRLAVLHGDLGAEAISDRRRRSRSWFDLSDEERYLERFERAARAGAWVVGVDLPEAAPKARERVREILAENGGHTIVSRSRWTHEVEG